VILVAGGTGTLGTEVVRLLLAEARRVRVLTRDRRRAAHLPPGVEIVSGDLRNAAEVRAAVAGCSVVISAVHGFAGPDSPSPELIDRDGNRALIRAASDAGVNHLVLLSVQGARPDHPMSLHRAKHAAEQELRGSGIGFTIIRPTAFLETWVSVIGGPLADKGYALVFGPGRNPINFVSVRDVAALVVMALQDGAMRGATVEIGGAENLGFVTLAERILEASGRRGRIKRIPLLLLRAMALVARPFSPVFARQARAAVVMNTTDLKADASLRARFPSLPNTTLKEVLEARRQSPET
jgi:uncharacterized protein YbjT (DUF2867 family)